MCAQASNEEEWSEKVANDLMCGVESMILTLNKHYGTETMGVGRAS